MKNPFPINSGKGFFVSICVSFFAIDSSAGAPNRSWIRPPAAFRRACEVRGQAGAGTAGRSSDCYLYTAALRAAQILLSLHNSGTVSVLLTLVVSVLLVECAQPTDATRAVRVYSTCGTRGHGMTICINSSSSSRSCERMISWYRSPSLTRCGMRRL